MSESPPPSTYQKIDTLFGDDGGGCSRTGSEGDYQKAYAEFKQKAADMGANYAHITKIERPHWRNDFCYAKRVKIFGVGYRK